MRSPLVEYMMTPMAAPETRSLKVMRVVLMMLCAAVAGGTMLISVLVEAFGLRAAAVMAVLVVATPIHALVYFRKKNAVDEAYGRGAGS